MILEIKREIDKISAEIQDYKNTVNLLFSLDSPTKSQKEAIYNAGYIIGHKEALLQKLENEIRFLNNVNKIYELASKDKFQILAVPHCK